MATNSVRIKMGRKKIIFIRIYGMERDYMDKKFHITKFRMREKCPYIHHKIQHEYNYQFYGLYCTKEQQDYPI